MDVEQPRLYIREWKRNKPHLPKSTSLPVLRLAPQNRTIFVCKQCGFSNFLVPMCLWCCWSSAEARHEFEANARKTLRRAARSTPRPFNKPSLSMSSQRIRDIGAGKRKRSVHCHIEKAPTFRRPHACGRAAVIPDSTTAFTLHRSVRRPLTWLSDTARNSNRYNGGRGVEISEPRTAKSHRNQGLYYTERGTDDCGTGSTKNNYCPPEVAFKHPRLSTVFSPLNHSQAGHNTSTTGGFSPSPLPDPLISHCVQPWFPKLPSPTFRLSARTLLATLIPFRGSRGPLKDNATENSRVIDSKKKELDTKSSFRTMLVDRPAVDTRCTTTTESYIVSPPWTTATHATTIMCDGKSTPDTKYNYQVSESMDVDGATLIQCDQALTSPMNRSEACTIAEQRAGSDLDDTTEMVLTKAGKRRPPIPNILLTERSIYSDTPIASESQASQISMTTEMATPVEKCPFQSQSPARTLRRKKRLSLTGLSSECTNNLIPPDPPMPLSPPPLQTSYSPQFSPIFPPVVTPPASPNRHYPASGSFSPTIVLSTPTSTTPMLVQPSMAIPHLTTKSSQPLPRIGTPQRPYYSTVRANMNARSASSISPVSTPPPSPSSSTFASAYGGSQSPTSGEMPGSPDRNTHLGAGFSQQHASVLDDGIVAANNTPVGTVPQPPTAALAIQTVLPLPAVMTPVPAQMHMCPSSPVRGILSVLDPDKGEGEKDEFTYNHFGMNSSRFGRVLRERRSGNMKEKGKVRGDHSGGGYQFPLSLSLSLGRKRGRTFATANQRLDKNDTLASPRLSHSQSCTGLGGIGVGKGCSVSGEVEMRMALAERSLNANDYSANSLQPGFKFHKNHRPTYDAEIQMTRSKSTGKKLMKMRSSIGLSSGSLTSSLSRSPSSLKIGSRLKEMSANFLGKFQGGGANRP